MNAKSLAVGAALVALTVASTAAAAPGGSGNDAEKAAMARYMSFDCDQLKTEWSGLVEQTDRMASAERAGELAEPANELARLKAEFSLVGYAMLLKNCPAVIPPSATP